MTIYIFIECEWEVENYNKYNKIISYLKSRDKFERYFKLERPVPKHEAPIFPISLELFIFQRKFKITNFILYYF